MRFILGRIAQMVGLVLCGLCLWGETRWQLVIPAGLLIIAGVCLEWAFYQYYG